MKFLFLNTKYSIAVDDPYMTDELAGGLIARGHTVDVLHLDWDAPLGAPSTEVRGRYGERVVRVAPRALRAGGILAYRASKFVMSSRAALAAMKRSFRGEDYDVVVAWAPALTVASPLRHATRTGVPHRILFIWDFFPTAHREIGMIRSPAIYRAAKWLEDRLYRTFTTFIPLLPGNIDYLRKHFTISPDQRVVWTPIWTDNRALTFQSRASVRAELGIAPDRPVAVFGGQLSEGRGIEQMLDAARVSHERGSPAIYLFIGQGRLSGAIKQDAARYDNVRYLSPVPRARYLDIVAACDVGLVATVEAFTSWALPTKTIDYLRAAVPIVTAVEPGSDYPTLLEPYDISINVASGDGRAMAAAVDELTSPTIDRDRLRSNARRCLDEVFDLRHAVDTLLAAVEQRPSPTLETP